MMNRAEKEINQIADMTAEFYVQGAVMFYCISDRVFVKDYR